MSILKVIHGGENKELTSFKERIKKLIHDHKKEKRKLKDAINEKKPEKEIKIIAAELNQLYRDIISAIKEAYEKNAERWNDFREYLESEPELNIDMNLEEEKDVYERNIKLNLNEIEDDIKRQIAMAIGNNKEEKHVYVRGLLKLSNLEEDIEALKTYEDEAAIIDILTKIIDAIPETPTDYLSRLLYILDQITSYGNSLINGLFGYRKEIWSQENYAQTIKKLLTARLLQEKKIEKDFEPLLIYILTPEKYAEILALTNTAEKGNWLKQELDENQVTTIASTASATVIVQDHNEAQERRRMYERNIRQVNLLLKGKLTKLNVASLKNKDPSPIEFSEAEEIDEERLRQNAIEITPIQKKFLTFAEKGKEDAIHELILYDHRCYLICKGVYIAFYFNLNTTNEIVSYHAFPKNIQSRS